jgi:hypothetical protein
MKMPALLAARAHCNTHFNLVQKSSRPDFVRLWKNWTSRLLAGSDCRAMIRSGYGADWIAVTV